MNLGPCGTDVHVVGLGLDFGLGRGLVVSLGIALGVALGVAFGIAFGLALGLGNYLKHFGWHEQMGIASRPKLALALKPSNNISQYHPLHTR